MHFNFQNKAVLEANSKPECKQCTCKHLSPSVTVWWSEYTQWLFALIVSGQLCFSSTINTGDFS